MAGSSRLSESIEQAVVGEVAGLPRVGVAYSGGLDSTVLAILARRITAVTCHTACTQDSYDRRSVPTQAASDGFEVRMIELAPRDIRRLAGLAAYTLDTDNPVQVGYSIPLFAVLEAAEEDAILVGNCADELFAGYAKYESAKDVTELMEFDLEKALSELDKLKDYAKSEHKRIVAPYASDEVVKAASAVPMARKIGSEGRKLILRDVAYHLGAKGHDRPKKAAQYSSGVAKAMERMAKKDGLTQTEWVTEQRIREATQSSNR